MGIVVILAVFPTLDSFKPGYLASWDGPAHIVRAEVFYNNLNLARLGIWGWYHGWYLGVAPFIFYPPGFFLVLSLMKVFTLGCASMDFLIRILMALTYVLFPPTLYWLSRRLGFSSRTSIIASILSLSFSGIWGIGLAGIYAIGLYTHIFSLLPFMLFWGCLHNVLKNNGSHTITGLLFGCIIITSIITALFATMLIFAYVLLFLIIEKQLTVYKIYRTIIIGILFSLFWIFPFLTSKDLFGIETSFNPFELWELTKNLLFGKIIYSPIISAFFVLGIGVSLWYTYQNRLNSFPHIFLIVLLCLTIFVSSNLLTTLTLSWQHSNMLLQVISRVFRSTLRMRDLSFLWIIIPIIAAIGIDFVLGMLNKCLCPNIANIISVVVLLSLMSLSYVHISSLASINVKTTDYPDYKEQFEEWALSFNWLKENAAKQSVVLTDINWNQYVPIGTVSIDSLINLETGLRTVRGDQIETTQLNIWNLDNSTFNSDEYKQALFKYNIDYILSYKKPKYNASYLSPVYRSRDIIIYKTVGLHGAYQVKEYNIEPNEYKTTIQVFQEGEVELPLQYNNHWHADVNEKCEIVKRGNTGLVKISLRPGINSIRLLFKRTLIETLCVGISFITILFSIYTLYSKNRDYIIRRIIKKEFFPRLNQYQLF